MLKRPVLLLLIASTLLSACASSEKPVSNEAPSGKWTGDYAVGPNRRETISVELRWEGSNLRGVVQSGSRSLPLTKATFKPETGAISMEFDTEGNRGQVVHYVIDGNVSGNRITGSWSHDDQRGDFQVTRE